MKNRFPVVAFVVINCLSAFNSLVLRSPEGQLQEEQRRIFDLRVYRIESRKISEVLTANWTILRYPAYSNRNGVILATTTTTFTSAWIDDASQKWRLDKSFIYDSFALLPTDNEDFALEYDGNSIATWGFGYNKYWYLMDAGHGYYMIKNQHSGFCLQAKESNQTVSVKKCDNSIYQQWRFILLSE